MRIALLSTLLLAAACGDNTAEDLSPDATTAVRVGDAVATFTAAHCQQVAVCATLVPDSEPYRAHVATCVDAASASMCATADCDAAFKRSSLDACLAELAAVTAAVLDRNDRDGCFQPLPAPCAALFAAD